MDINKEKDFRSMRMETVMKETFLMEKCREKPK